MLDREVQPARMSFMITPKTVIIAMAVKISITKFLTRGRPRNGVIPPIFN